MKMLKWYLQTVCVHLRRRHHLLQTKQMPMLFPRDYLTNFLCIRFPFSLLKTEPTVFTYKAAPELNARLRSTVFRLTILGFQTLVITESLQVIETAIASYAKQGTGKQVDMKLSTTG